MKIKHNIMLATAGLGAACLVGCAPMSPNPKSTVTKADFGKTPEGQAVEIYTLHNAKGAEAKIMTYGGIVQSLTMPDKNGKLADIVLGIYREEMFQPDSGVDGATELLVLKNRNGNLGYVDLYFYKQWLRFEDMLDPDR